MNKGFKTYAEAYQLYSDIVAGRDKDRKNATIIYVRGDYYEFYVYWEEVK